MNWILSLDDIKVPAFDFSINLEGKIYNLHAEQSHLSVQIERFTVKGKDGKREIVLQSDRPSLRLKEAKKGISWKLIKGQEIVTKNPQAFEAILRAIEGEIKHIEKPPPKIEDHLKNRY